MSNEPGLKQRVDAFMKHLYKEQEVDFPYNPAAFWNLPRKEYNNMTFDELLKKGRGIDILSFVTRLKSIKFLDNKRPIQVNLIKDRLFDFELRQLNINRGTIAIIGSELYSTDFEFILITGNYKRKIPHRLIASIEFLGQKVYP